MFDFILWVLMGLVAGWIASIIMKTNSQQGPIADIILGVLGAIVGGFIMNVFGTSGATGFNIYSLFVATLGAVLLIWLGRLFQRAA